MVEIGPLSNAPWPDNAPGPYEPGRYVCVRTHGWGARVIRLATHSPYNHAFMITSSLGDIIEATPEGVREGRISEYAGCQAVINTDAMDSQQQAHLVSVAHSFVGTRYNDLAIANDGLESLGVFWNWLARCSNEDHEVVCSQLVALIGQHAGYDWFHGKSYASEVTPADLANRPLVKKFAIEG